MKSERIDRQYADSQELCKYLMSEQEVSFANYVSDVYTKVLLLSAASYFESRISKILIEYAKKVSGSDKRIANLVEAKVVERQYHTLFNWKDRNTNSFWKLFGEDTKLSVREKIDKEDGGELREAELSFLFIGNQRNMLVHENFAEFNFNHTAEEIYGEYEKACKFISFIELVLDPTYVKS